MKRMKKLKKKRKFYATLSFLSLIAENNAENDNKGCDHLL